MAFVVVGVAFGLALPDRQGRLGAVKSLDPGLRVSAPHERVVGRVQVEPGGFVN